MSWNGPSRGMAPRGMMRGRAPPPGYSRRPMAGRRPPDEQPGYPDGAPVPMPYSPESPSDRQREWSDPNRMRYSEESPRLPGGEHFGINAAYAGATSREDSPYGPPESQPSGDFISSEHDRQPLLDQRPNAYGYGAPTDGYQGRAAASGPPIPEHDTRASGVLGVIQDYETQPSDGHTRNPTSFGFSGRRPYAPRTEGMPEYGSSASPPQINSQYGQQEQILEMDGSHNRSNVPEATHQDQMPSMELDSRELGAQAPLGDHAHG